jgi:hypothetical protein
LWVRPKAVEHDHDLASPAPSPRAREARAILRRHALWSCGYHCKISAIQRLFIVASPFGECAIAHPTARRSQASAFASRSLVIKNEISSTPTSDMCGPIRPFCPFCPSHRRRSARRARTVAGDRPRSSISHPRTMQICRSDEATKTTNVASVACAAAKKRRGAVRHPSRRRRVVVSSSHGYAIVAGLGALASQTKCSSPISRTTIIVFSFAISTARLKAAPLASRVFFAVSPSA